METTKKNNSVLVQGTILAMAGIIVRLISIIYRVPMTNIIGDEGNGYYSCGYQIYNIVLLISSYSLPQAVSKLVSQRLVKKQFRNANRIFLCALIFATATGAIFSVALFLFADVYAKLVHMELASLSIKILAPTIFVVAFLSVFRGFFQGFRTMVPTALSQIVEQVVNAVASIIFVIILSGVGAKTDLVKNTGNSYAASLGAAGATIGTLLGAIAGFAFLYLYFRGTYPSFKRRMSKEPANRVYSYGKVYKLLIATSVPIVISALIFNMVTVVDNIILSQSLAKMNVAKELIARKWGVFTGKYLLLINIPIAFATALSSSAIPAIAQASEQKNKGELIHRIDIIEKFTMIISLPCAFGLAILAKPIILVLFPKDNSNASILLMMGTASVVFFSISTITNGVLHGLGKMSVPIKNSLIAFVVHIISLCIMTFGLHLAEYGVVISYMIFGLVVSVLNLRTLSIYTKSVRSVSKMYILPFIASVVMSVVVLALYYLLHSLVGRLISLMLAIFVGMFVYLVAILKLGTVDDDELIEFPFGRRIQKFARKFHLC